MLTNPWDATSIILPQIPVLAVLAVQHSREKTPTRRTVPPRILWRISLTAAVKKNIVHMYYDLLLTPEEIAPLILSPRKASGGVGVRAVRDVLDFFQVYHHVEDVPRVHRAVKMPEAHVVMLI